MVIALDPNETFDYVLEEDRESPESERVVFQLRRTLTPTERRDLLNLMPGTLSGSGEQTRIEFSLGANEVYTIGAAQRLIRGWRNLTDHNGKPVPCERDNRGLVRERSLDRLRPEWIEELVEVAMRQTGLGEVDDETKKP